MTQQIGGAEAVRVAMEAANREAIRLESAADSSPEVVSASGQSNEPKRPGGRSTPPRVRKPSPLHDKCLAPTADLGGHRARLREAFGNTMSDEFVDVMLGKLVEALRPSPFDQLEESTLNAGLALKLVRCNLDPSSRR
jgi:hypothetical protein